MPDAAVWLGLIALAVVTSTISAVVGLAGGILLLAAMLLYLDPIVAIPVHGAVQLASNASRAHLQRAHIRFDVVGRFALPLLPAGAAALVLIHSLSADLGRLGIGCFALVATWAPDWFRLGTAPAVRSARHRFLWAGSLVGFCNVLFGATGPLVAPFVLSLGLSRQGTIGTLAACQTLGHLAKIALFGIAGFAFADYWLPIAGLAVAAIVGSALGTRLLQGVDEKRFAIGVRVVLTLVATRLVWDGVSSLV